MFYHTDAQIQHLAIHRVGNKLRDEFYTLSDRPVELQDELLATLLMHYFLSPFAKVNEVYRLFHPSGNVSLNEMYHFCDAFFAGSMDFYELSVQVCKHLFESSSHPQIKSGEVYVVHVDGITLEGETHEAVGIFKSENKETYLKVSPAQGLFNLSYEQEAININKLDKGCLIVRTEREEGFKVLVVDQTNRQQEAVYWKDDFLSIRIRNDAYQQTGNFLKVYKQFVEDGLDDAFELNRADKIELLNRSMDYFKEKTTFRQEEFEEEVLGNPQATSLFKDYCKQYGEALDAPLNNEFDISGQAVKKARAAYRSVLKLDKNFHVYVHGRKDYIERGYDEEKGLHYYKLYFKEEQ